MSAYRKPPKPKHYNSPRGFCRFCGKEIIKEGKRNNRANWHKPCVEKYRIIHFPRDTREAVWKRDLGQCADCGITCMKSSWELDHRKPLIEAKGRIEFWQLENLQTLCSPCHAKKTGAEATARAAKRRAKKTKKII